MVIARTFACWDVFNELAHVPTQLIALCIVPVTTADIPIMPCHLLSPKRPWLRHLQATFKF